MTPQRIAILGGAGSGKSTFARALGEALELPVVHLDRFVFGPNWRPVDLETVRQTLTKALWGKAWVVDGVWPDVSDLTVAPTDLIVWLDQPVWRRFYRAWRKTRRHRSQPRHDRPDGCEEVFGVSYVMAILRFGRWSGAIEQTLTAQAPGARLVRLRGDAAARRFLDDIISDNIP